MSSKITPTPWKFDDTEGCRSIKGGKMGDGRQAQYTKLGYTCGLEDDDKDQANANAIVSAVNNTYGAGINPEAVSDLLDVVKKFLAVTNDRWRPLPATSHEKNIMSSARAAIEKAKI